jgi:hypothetical protein
MNIRLHRLKRYAYAAVALGFAATIGSLAVLAGSAAAANQVTSRSIGMSNAIPSATGVSYKVTYTAATTNTIGGIVVDICGDTPLIGSITCTYPAGFTWGSATPTISPAGTVTVNGSGTTGWTAAGFQGGAGGGSYQTLELSNATPATVNSGNVVTFTITTATNPSTTNLSFYARIVTFDTAAHMTSASTGYLQTGDTTTTTRPATFTGEIDYGGVALSTATQVSITAYVMEQLGFCDSNATISTCGTVGTPAITIGHGSPQILDGTVVDTNSVYTMTSTNAQHGAVVYMKDTSGVASGCGGLSSNGGTSCGIPSINTVGTNNQTTSYVIAKGNTSGNPAFGMCVLPGSANTTAYSPYNGANCATSWSGTEQYALVDGAATNSVTGTYGSEIFSSTGALNAETDSLNFAATATNTTIAGIYTANYSLIATGTF